jgi:integrase
MNLVVGVYARRANPDRLVFEGRDGGYLTDFEYRHLFDPAAKEIGPPGLVPHELRHTCADSGRR